MFSVKAYLRRKLIGCQPCYQRYTRLKYKLKSMWDLSFFLHDLRNTWRHMYWGNDAQMTTAQLQAKLLFFYHKIEKGLCMPGKKRLFALEVIPQVVQLLKTWESTGKSVRDPIYVGAINSLRSYNDLIHKEELDPEGKISVFVSDFLASRSEVSAVALTPITIAKSQLDATVSYDEFRRLCELRRSFREFSDQSVPDDVIRRAVELAQLSPSACNRQPCKVYVIKDKEVQQALLSHQNGNAGFGHLAPIVMVLTADASHFFGAIERHQPYVDGGLFSMSLLYALQVQGLVSCCLNWCVTPNSDAKVHNLLTLPDSERVVMFILAGYPIAETVVPKSHRKSVESVLVFK